MSIKDLPKPHPPRWAEKFLKWYCAPHLADEILGDMQEAFDHNVKLFGERRARREYVRDVIGFFKPFAIKRKKIETRGWPTRGNQMRNHYFTVVVRNLSRHKTFFDDQYCRAESGACVLHVDCFIHKGRG